MKTNNPASNFFACLLNAWLPLIAFLTIFLSPQIAISKSLQSITDTTNVMDNKMLVSLTKSGLSAEVIIEFINSSTTNFDCSMAAIVALKKDSVQEKVLVEVMKRCASQSNSISKTANSNNPTAMHEGGIYYYHQKDTSSEFILKKLYSTVVSGKKAGGFGAAVAQSYTYGLAKSSVKAQISGANSNSKVPANSEFYFYFDAANQDASNANAWWFHTASSPNEFSLIKLKPKGNIREFKIGTSNAYTEKTGIDDDQKIDFTFEEIGHGIFKITPKKPLPVGEYCFIYSATVPSMYSNDKVFDFSIIN